MSLIVVNLSSFGSKFVVFCMVNVALRQYFPTPYKGYTKVLITNTKVLQRLKIFKEEACSRRLKNHFFIKGRGGNDCNSLVSFVKGCLATLGNLLTQTYALDFAYSLHYLYFCPLPPNQPLNHRERNKHW